MPEDDLQLGVTITSDPEDFNRGMDSMISRVFSFEGAILAASAAVGFFATRALARATKAAAGFEEALVGVQKVTNFSEEEMGELSSRLREMAIRTTVSLEELTEIAEVIGRLGQFAPDEIARVTEVVAQMGIATDIAGEEAARGLLKITKQTDATIDDVRMLGDVVNALSNNFGVSTSEIVEATTRAGNAMSLMGEVSAQEILAMNAAFAETTESAPRAGSRMRRFAQQLMDPRQIDELADLFGMTNQKFNEIRESAPVGTMLALALAGEKNQQVQQELNRIFSVQGQQVLADARRNLGTYFDALEVANEQAAEGGSLQEEFSKALDTFNRTAARTRNIIHDIFIEVGQFFLPIVTDMLEDVNRVIDVFREWNRATDGALGATIGLSGAVLGLTIAVGSFLHIFRVTTGTIKAGIAGAFRPLRSLLLLLIPSSVINALGRLAGFFRTIGSVIRTRILPVLGGLARFLKGLGIAALVGLFSRFRGILIKLIPAPVLAALARFSGFLKGIASRLGPLQRFFALLPGPLKLIAGILAIGMLAALIDVQQAWTDLRRIVDNVVGGIADFLKGTGKKLVRQGMFALGQVIRGIAVETARFVTLSDKSILKRIVLDIVTYFTSGAVLADLGEAAKILFDVIAAAAEGLVAGLIGDKDATFKTMFRDIKQWLVTTGKQILRTAADKAIAGIVNSFLAAKQRIIGGSVIPDMFSEIDVFVRGKGQRSVERGFGSVAQKIDESFKNVKSPLATMAAGGTARPMTTNNRSLQTVSIGPITIQANSRREGRAAARGLAEELRSHNIDSSMI